MSDTEGPAVDLAADGTLRVGELATPSVPHLQVTAYGAFPVVLLDGALLKGGLQDRVAVGSTLLAPGTTASVDVRCVEQERWSGRREHSVGTARGSSFVRGRQDQHEVWRRVAVERGRPSRGVDVSGLLPLPGQSGVLIGFGGIPTVLEVFADERMLPRPGPGSGRGGSGGGRLARKVTRGYRAREFVGVVESMKCDPAGRGVGRSLVATAGPLELRGVADGGRMLHASVINHARRTVRWSNDADRRTDQAGGGRVAARGQNCSEVSGSTGDLRAVVQRVRMVNPPGATVTVGFEPAIDCLLTRRPSRSYDETRAVPVPPNATVRCSLVPDLEVSKPVKCPPPSVSSVATSGMTISASTLPVPPDVRTATVVAFGLRVRLRSIGSSSIGAGALPCAPTAPYRTVPRVPRPRAAVLLRGEPWRKVDHRLHQPRLVAGRQHPGDGAPWRRGDVASPLHCDSPGPASGPV